MSNIIRSSYHEASEILHNARQARLRGEITEEEYQQIKQTVFNACADNISIALLFTPEVEIGEDIREA